MKPEPAPVVTMDENDSSLWLAAHPRPRCLLGYISGDGFTWADSHPIITFAELRALADFLDQLAGANLLSEVVEG